MFLQLPPRCQLSQLARPGADDLRLRHLRRSDHRADRQQYAHLSQRHPGRRERVRPGDRLESELEQHLLDRREQHAARLVSAGRDLHQGGGVHLQPSRHATGDAMTKTTHYPFPPFTRRSFLTGALAAGALTGLPAGLLADGRGPAGKPGSLASNRGTTSSTSHTKQDTKPRPTISSRAAPASRSTGCRDHPGVLQHHRKKNRFLQGVPDDQLTHFVQNVRLSADFVTMSYVIQGADTNTGTWNMSAMYFRRRRAGSPTAAALAVERAGSDPIPLSAKRALYGHRPGRNGAGSDRGSHPARSERSRHRDHRHASRSLQRRGHERGYRAHPLHPAQRRDRRPRRSHSGARPRHAAADHAASRTGRMGDPHPASSTTAASRSQQERQEQGADPVSP